MVCVGATVMLQKYMTIYIIIIIIYQHQLQNMRVGKEYVHAPSSNPGLIVLGVRV